MRDLYIRWMELPDQITKNGLDSVRFQDTDHYRTTVRFLQNPESAIEDILGIAYGEKDQET